MGRFLQSTNEFFFTWEVSQKRQDPSYPSYRSNSYKFFEVSGDPGPIHLSPMNRVPRFVRTESQARKHAFLATLSLAALAPSPLVVRLRSVVQRSVASS